MAWGALAVDWQAARRSLERQANAFASLVDGADLRTKAVGLQWTVDDVVAHLVAQARSFTAFADGTRAPDDDLRDGDASLPLAARIARINDRLISAQPTRDVVGAVRSFLDTTARLRGDDPFQSWEGELDLANATALLVSELTVHGDDVARALRRPWRIDPRDGATALTVGANLMPRFVDATRAAALDVRYSVTARPGPEATVTVHGGVLTVAPGRAARGHECGSRRAGGDRPSGRCPAAPSSPTAASRGSRCGSRA